MEAERKPAAGPGEALKVDEDATRSPILLRIIKYQPSRYFSSCDRMLLGSSGLGELKTSLGAAAALPEGAGRVSAGGEPTTRSPGLRSIAQPLCRQVS